MYIKLSTVSERAGEYFDGAAATTNASAAAAASPALYDLGVSPTAERFRVAFQLPLVIVREVL